MALVHEQLLEPIRYLTSLPSKDVRGRFIASVAADFALDLRSEYLDAVAALTHALHTASLALDDIEDATQVRRGHPAAHVVFGTPLTINAACLSIFEACTEFSKTLAAIDCPLDRQLTANRVVQEELVLLHVGQGKDILWRELSYVPSLSEYREMTEGKTGGLFRLIARLLLVLSPLATGRNDDLVALSNDLGYLFQIMDDFLNVVSPPVCNGLSTGTCDDFTEGKASFLVVHHCACVGANDSRLRLALRQRSADCNVKLQCWSLLVETNSFAFAVSHIKAFSNDLTNRLQRWLDRDDGEVATLIRSLQDRVPTAALNSSR